MAIERGGIPLLERGRRSGDRKLVVGASDTCAITPDPGFEAELILDPSIENLNAATSGNFVFILTAATLGLSVGSYYMEARRSDASDVTLTQSVTRLDGDNAGQALNRVRATGTWNDSDSFTPVSDGRTDEQIQELAAAFLRGNDLPSPAGVTTIVGRINAAVHGNFNLTLSSTTLGIPSGTYFLESRAIDESNVAFQRATRLTGSGAGTVYTRVRSSGVWTTSQNFAASTGGTGGTGLNQAAVDARIRAFTGQASTGGDIADSRISPSIARDSEIENFARVGNSATIPPAKLASGGSSGQVLTRTSSGQSWQTSSGGGGTARTDDQVRALAREAAYHTQATPTISSAADLNSHEIGRRIVTSTVDFSAYGLPTGTPYELVAVETPAGTDLVQIAYGLGTANSGGNRVFMRTNTGGEWTALDVFVEVTPAAWARPGNTDDIPVGKIRGNVAEALFDFGASFGNRPTIFAANVNNPTPDVGWFAANVSGTAFTSVRASGQSADAVTLILRKEDGRYFQFWYNESNGASFFRSWHSAPPGVFNAI